MILGGATAKTQTEDRITLDEVFRSASERRPGTLALVDSADRMQSEGIPPRSLTYAQADRMVSAIAGRLHRIGLSTDAVVGVQFPNNVDGVLTLLGILRAGMIAAPLPLLWRRADCVTALSRVGARAIITCGQHRGTDYSHIAMEVAAEIFPIRYVCGFGAKRADGVIPLGDLYNMEESDRVPPLGPERQRDRAAHLAVITFDTTADGLVAVARNHLELLSAGLAVVLESKVQQQAAILSAMALSSLAGLASGLMPWLLSGGTLVLHDAFAPDIFQAQIAGHRCDTLVLPGPIVARLDETHFLAGKDSVKNVLAVWRAPERLAGTAPWRNPTVAINDILAFGETAIVAGRRDEDGKPVSLPFGAVTAPRTGANAVRVADISRTDAGTLAIRGPMVPGVPFPADAERAGVPAMRIAPDGMVNTGYTCRHVRETNSIVVTGPPAGLISVGGYRFGLRELQDLIASHDPNGTVAALPDRLTGHRLAGHSTDRAAMRDALDASGVNPLLAYAFRERARPDTA